MDFPALKGIVVHGGGLGICGEGSAIFGIEKDQIGIAAWLDGALLREEVENFRCIRAGDIDECLEVEAAFADAVGVEEGDPVLQGGDAIRDFREIRQPHGFLGLKVKRLSLIHI